MCSESVASEGKLLHSNESSVKQSEAVIRASVEAKVPKSGKLLMKAIIHVYKKLRKHRGLSTCCRGKFLFMYNRYK
jgi:hypothetical protein